MSVANETKVLIEENVKIEKPESQIKIMWDALKKNKAALFGLIVILILVFIALFGDLIAPYGATETNMADAKQGMSAEHWFGTDVQGRDIFSRILSGT